MIGGKTASPDDDLIRDEALYHRYVDMLSEGDTRLSDPTSVSAAASRVAEDLNEPFPGAKKQLSHILQIMLYAHAASELRHSADALFGALQ